MHTASAKSKLDRPAVLSYGCYAMIGQSLFRDSVQRMPKPIRTVEATVSAAALRLSVGLYVRSDVSGRMC